MQEVYEKNMEAIKEIFGLMGRQLEEKDYETSEDIEVESLESLDGQNIFFVTKEGLKYTVHSPLDTLGETKAFIESYGEFHPYSTITMFGIGSGPALSKLYESTPESTVLLVYEPCIQIFLKLLQTYDISEMIRSRRVALVIKGLNEEELIPLWKENISNENFEYLRCRIHPHYGEFFGEEAKEFLHMYKRILEDIQVAQNTYAFFGNMYGKNVLLNAAELLDCITINQLRDNFPGNYPVLIVAAGPSLKKNIGLIHKLKNHAFILAVDTAARVIMNEGIRPDAMITVDGNKPMSLFEDVKDIPIIFSCDTNSDVIRELTGKKILTYNQEEVIQPFLSKYANGCSSLSSGGSVSNTAYSLARFLGSKEIILVGQDLAYTEGRSHVSGSFTEEEIAKKHVMASAEVEGVDGTMLKTQPNMLLFLRWFEEQIEKDKDITVYNATEGGAKMKGAEMCTLQEVIEEHLPKEEFDFEKMIADIPPFLKKEDREEAIAYFEEARQQTDEAMKKATEGQRWYKQVAKELGKKNVDVKKVKKLKKKLDRLTEYFEKDPIMCVPMRSVVAISYALARGMYDEEENLADEGDMIYRHGNVMLMSIKVAIRNILPIYDEAIARMKGQERSQL